MQPLDDRDELLRAVTAKAAAVARRKGIDEATCKDIAQDVVIAFVGLAEEPDNWRAWVTTATGNKVIDHFRRQQLWGNDYGQDADNPDADDYRDGRYRVGPSQRVIAKRLLEDAMGVVSEKERALLSVHFTGVSNEELAAQFGYANADSVKVIVARAKRKIRDAFPDRAAILGPQRLY